MKYIEKISVSAAVLLSSAAFTTPCTMSTPIDTATNEKSFIVLELFTSEGCSSCPPADELLAKLQQEKSDVPRYILSYHVDYWDRQGWRDAFSDPQFTKRQRQYTQWLNDPQLYTPQLVVNGKSSCVGSDELRIRSLEKNAKSKVVTNTLSIDAKQIGDKATFHYQLKESESNTQLLIAIVQKHATTKVMRGENEGRTLHHVQVVRNLSSLDVSLKKTGEHSITLPIGFNTKDWEIVAFTQNTTTGEITTATRASLTGIQ